MLKTLLSGRDSFGLWRKFEGGKPKWELPNTKGYLTLETCTYWIQRVGRAKKKTLNLKP